MSESKDIRNILVRVVGWFAKGMKINNVIVLAVICPIYLSFVWCFISFRIYHMFCSEDFVFRSFLHIRGYELPVTIVFCVLASSIILWPICRILQLSWPNTFDPGLESNDED